MTPLADTSCPRRPRLSAIDASRGLALIGMIIVNVGPVANDSSAQRLWLASYGRASILFVLLAGLGLSLLLRHGSRGRWPVVLWRAAILLLGGLALGLLPHGVAVILPLYGLLFALGLVLVRLPTAVLLGLAAAFAIVGPVVFIGESLEHSGEAPAPLSWGPDPLEILHSLVFTRPYPLIVWLVPFILGIAIGRLDLSDRTVQRRMTLWGLVAGVGALAVTEIAGLILGDVQTGYGLLLTGAAHGQMPLWLLGSIGTGIAVLGLLLSTWERIGRWLRPLVAAGQLALTLYVVHLVVLAVLGGEEGFTFGQGVLISTAIIVPSVLFAWAYRSRFATGPLEALLRARWLEQRFAATAAPASGSS